MYIALNFS